MVSRAFGLLQLLHLICDFSCVWCISMPLYCSIVLLLVSMDFFLVVSWYCLLRFESRELFGKEEI